MNSIDTKRSVKFETASPARLDELQPTTSLTARVQLVASVAAAHAERVDREASFPLEAIEAAKQQGLLAPLVPHEFGGEGAPLSAVAEICYVLGQACASTGMIVAMHSAALACIIDHCSDSRWHMQLLRRVARDNLLFASSTTEGSAGGNVRSSAAPLVYDGDRITLDRAATVVSYGAQADGIVTTARRDADAGASDQALVVFLKDENYRLETTGGWETLGMRGTCSSGFALKASGLAAQVLPVGYDKIHPLSMVPVSHLAWSAVWTGIAAAAVGRAQNFVRTAARRAGGQKPPGAAQYTEAVAALRSLRSLVASALANYESMRGDPLRLGALETQTGLNLLKVEASEQAVKTVSMSMRACGLAGYRNDGEFTMGRHLRDVLSAPIMVHNDRILTNVASTTLMSGVPASLMD